MKELYKILLFSSAAFIISGVIFFNIAWFTSNNNEGDTITNPGDVITEEERARLDLMNAYLEDKGDTYSIQEDLDAVDRDQIRTYLQALSSKPHVAAEPQDEVLVSYISDLWEQQGLEVQVSRYNLFMSKPDPNNPNFITLSNDEDGEFFRSSAREDIPNLDENFIDAFLAYTPPGEATGDIVYVNYGQTSDFEYIHKSTPYFTNTTGKICMMRYGSLYRGNKIQNAQAFGCIAAILFSDPAEIAVEGVEAENVYPETEFLPGSGIQRGSSKPVNGDPQTPNWPSLDRAYRIPEEELLSLPQIPSQPIGYDDAKRILECLGGKHSPAIWKGRIPGVEYRIGGEFLSSCGSNVRAHLQTFNRYQSGNNANVFGIIRGDVEPDRYLLLGNHRDAWGFGSVDASSGTAQMLELTRILGNKLKTGWRPRRTIIFCSWGAEEFGIMGSREFAEDFMDKMTERAMAYINTDVCTAGPFFSGKASPMLRGKLVQALKEVPDPANPSQSYYDRWRTFWEESSDGDGFPDSVPVPGSGSDHASFIFYLGVPVIDLAFYADYLKYPDVLKALYPLYHTGFETFEAMDTVLDPEFETHHICTMINLVLIRSLGDDLVTDFEPAEYVSLMESAMADFDTGGVIDQLIGLGVDIDSVREMIDEFDLAVKAWTTRAEASNRDSDPFVARALNDQVSKIDRLFIMEQGLPDRPDVRHSIISPSKFNSYGSSFFPGISDLLHNYDTLSVAEQEERVLKLKMHVSDLMIQIKAAADYLNDVHLIE